MTQNDHNREAVEAARSVLLEIVHVLGEYRDNIVLIGGWVPLFLCPSPEEPHVGSMDLELAWTTVSLQRPDTGPCSGCW